VRPWHTPRSGLSRCTQLRASYVITKRHPSGVLQAGYLEDDL